MHRTPRVHIFLFHSSLGLNLFIFFNSLEVPVKVTKAVTLGNNRNHTHNHGLASRPSPICHEMFPRAASPAVIYIAWAKSSSGRRPVGEKNVSTRRVPSLFSTCSETIGTRRLQARPSIPPSHLASNVTSRRPPSIHAVDSTPLGGCGPGQWFVNIISGSNEEREGKEIK